MLFHLCYTVPLLVAMLGQVEEPDPNLTRERKGRVTLGGTQYWTDHLVCHGWRIQRNVRFGQFRLLKPTNRVAQTGNYNDCRQAFDSVFLHPDFPRIPRTVLVSLHGLGRTRNSMSGIGQYVSTEGGYGWINLSYASTRAEIHDHARALRKVLDELASLKAKQVANNHSTEAEHGGIEFHFIAHSLGNIVIRNMLSDIDRSDAEERPKVWRVGRMVMIGPPNQGSAMANLLRKSNVFRLVAGSSGKDLGAEWEALQTRLVTPRCEFAIIAGGRGDARGFNLILKGDDDLIVRVDETKLSGAADFAVIPAVHTYMMNHREVKAMTLRFLQTGFLRSAETRTRLP